MNVRWIIPLPCLAIGFAVGILQDDASSESLKPTASLEAGGSSSESPNVTSGIAASDPGQRDQLAKQLKAISYLPSQVQRGAEVSELFASLSLSELLLASELLEQLPSILRDDAQLLLAVRLLEIDPQAAGKFVRGQSDDLGYLASRFMWEWQRRDPKAAISWFIQGQTQGIPHIRQRQASFALRDWAATDPQRAAELVISSPAQFGEFGVNAVFESWAKQNPADAMSGASTLGNSRLRQSAMQAALKTWVENDPESAFKWFQDLTDESMRNQLAAGIAIGLATKDRPRSIELAHSLPEGRMRDITMTKLAESFRFTALEESLSLVHEVPFEPGNQALKSYYQGLLFENAGAAITSLLQRAESATDSDERRAIEKFLNDTMSFPIPRGMEGVAKSLVAASTAAGNPLRLDLLKRALNKWAGDDMNGARKWSESLPPGEARNLAMAGVIQSWAWSAPTEAAAWIDQQPPSTGRDAAVSSYVSVSLSRNPADSLARLRTIRDPASQLTALQEGWRNWLRRDRAAAEAWSRNTADLSAAERAVLKPDAP